jgi:hypothetical protein
MFKKMANAVNPYGDGRAASRIVEAIRYHFGLRATRPEEFQGASGPSESVTRRDQPGNRATSESIVST